MNDKYAHMDIRGSVVGKYLGRAVGKSSKAKSTQRNQWSLYIIYRLAYNNTVVSLLTSAKVCAGFGMIITLPVDPAYSKSGLKATCSPDAISEGSGLW